ncbi:glycosyltransferase [Roseomonas sp. WA12]
MNTATASILDSEALPDDIVTIFELVLNRKLSKEADIAFHAGRTIRHVLLHVSRSAEFRREILPQLAERDTNSKLGRETFKPGVTSWLNRVLPGGKWERTETKLDTLLKVAALVPLPVAAGFAPVPTAQASAHSMPMPPLRKPAPTSIAPAPPKAGPVRVAPTAVSSPAASEEQARAAAPTQDKRATAVDRNMIRRMICGETGQVSATSGEDAVFFARSLILETGADVFRALSEGRPVPQEAVFGEQVPPDLQVLARSLFSRTKQVARTVVPESWGRFLLGLVSGSDSDLNLDDPAFASHGRVAETQKRLVELKLLRQQATETVGRADPFVKHPMFTAPVSVTGIETLFRFILGRAPTKQDDLNAAVADGYLACMKRFFLSPEFEREVLTPLWAGKSLRHVTNAALGEESLQLLTAMFGRPGSGPVSWPGDLIRYALDPRIVEAALGPVADGEPDPRQAQVHASLRALAELASHHPGWRSPFTVEAREGRRYRVRLERAEARGPMRGTLDLGALSPADPPPEILFTGEPPQATFTIPVIQNDGFAYAGTITVAGFGEEPVRLPIAGRVTRETVQDVLKKQSPEVGRSHFLAARGRNRESQNLLRRILADVPVLVDGWCLLAELHAVSGRFAEAAAIVGRCDRYVPDSPKAAELAGRIALAQGDVAQASEHLAKLAKGQDLSPAVRLLEAAAAWRPDKPLPALAGVNPWVQEQLFRLLHDRGRPVGFLLTALSNARAGAEGGQQMRLAIEVLALAFIPADQLMEVVRECDRQGMNIVALAAEMSKRNALFLLLPGLIALPPSRFQDETMLLAVARTADHLSDHVTALRFAEAAIERKPDDFDALNLAANMQRRLRRLDPAIALMERALALKPEDAKLRERLMAAELDAIKQNPLRPKARATELLDWLMNLRQKALFEAPASVEVRFDYARAAVMKGMLDEASIILEQLTKERPDWREPKALLVRIAQLRGDEEGVLRWFGTMSEAEKDARLIVAALKSMRAVGQFEDAEALLLRYADIEDMELRRESVRSLFFVGEFERATALGERYLKLYPRDLELRLLMAAAHQELGRHETAFFHVSWVYMNGGLEAFPLEMPLFLYSVAHKTGDTSMGLSHLDPMFGRVGAQSVRIDRRYGHDPFDSLMGTGIYPVGEDVPQPVFDGPKVSVIMTSYNVTRYLPTAVRSILQQSYRNLELIIVDDASTDATPDLLMEIERSDPRVKVILKSTNDGTYVSKNLGILQSQGEIIALQDSDDWSHPDRIACSVGVLMRHPEVMGLTTDWLRMTTDGDIVIKAGGQISHRCCISLVFRRAPVMDRLGFFDSVRIAADLEFIQRMGLVFGENAVPRLRWPLLFGRARSDSLTASEEFGVSRTGFTEPRQVYHRHSEEFHARIVAGGPAYLPFPQLEREFKAPAIILPSKGND